MTWSQQVSDIFSVASAVLISVGGAGAVLIMLSSWLGRVWASRILEREKTELSKSIEVTRADLTSSIEREKAAMAAFHEEHKSELQELLSQRLDVLTRRRDVYALLATKMRIFLRADMPAAQLQNEKWAFLAAYDEGYLWASESVAASIRDFIEVIENKSVADKHLVLIPANAPGYAQVHATAQALDATARDHYQRCLLEMRRDSGFPGSDTEHRVVSFA